MTDRQNRAPDWAIVPELGTARLRLRSWRAADSEPFAALNADPAVTRFLGGALDRAASDALVARVQADWVRDGHGLWAVQVRDGPEFIGYVGLATVGFDAPFGPAVEIGWRLARAAWGHGFATEAARAALGFGFGDRSLPEVVSFTAIDNSRSRAVMARLGMTHDPAEDFDHPRLPVGHRLRSHVLYRLSAPDAAPGAAGYGSGADPFVLPGRPSADPP